MEQKEQTVEQCESRMKDFGQFFLRWGIVQSNAVLAIFQETLCETWENREEDTTLETIAESFGIFAAAEQEAVEPALSRGTSISFILSKRDTCSTKSVGAEEEPPVAKSFVGIGVTRCRQNFDQIDFVEIRGPSLCMAAVKTPQSAVG